MIILIPYLFSMLLFYLGVDQCKSRGTSGLAFSRESPELSPRCKPPQLGIESIFYSVANASIRQSDTSVGTSVLLFVSATRPS